MTQYIDKSVLVAEIERRIENNTEWKDACKSLVVLAASQAIEEDEQILSIINSLEVKEVELEKEIDMVRKHYFVNDDFDKVEIDGRTITNIAKHFYELGLKVAQK